ncbi:hypothetical protein G6F56_004227 [Rhizopus delemar]|nr:hypothetical protein G6F56_004227 [Rhizopus delemar]
MFVPNYILFDEMSAIKIKLLLDSWFLNDYVIPRGRKNKKKDDERKYELGKEPILSYVKEIAILYNEQSALGINKHSHPKGRLVKALLDTHAKKVTQKKRKDYEDRGKNTLNDGYSAKEMLDINRYFSTKGTITSARDRLVFLMSHAMLLQSQNAMEYGSAIRHKDCELCPVNAFAMYFFSLYHHQNAPFPSFDTGRNWHDTFLFPSSRNKDSHIPLQKYPDHYLWTNPIFAITEFSNFEQKLLATIVQNNQQFSMSQHLEVLLAEVTAAMKSGSIEESEASTRNIIADSFMQMAANITRPQRSSMIVETEEFSATVSDDLVLRSTNNEVMPRASPVQYKMNRNLVQVTDVWREYSVGLSGGPAIKSLEEDYGTKWRKDRTESKFYNTRLVLYKEIQKICERDCISTEEAAEKLERRRIELKASIDKLIKIIKRF